MSVRQILDSNGKIGQSFLPAFIQSDLAAPVIFQAEAPATAGNPVIYVEGSAASAVGGSLALVPGSRTGAAAPDAGLTIVAQPAGVSVYVGTDGQATNLLSVAGANGLSQVYDEKYNQPMGLRAITLTNTNILAVPQVGNVGEIFRCVQAGVAASAVAAIGTNFTVPLSGFYTLQIEYKLQNAAAPAAYDINVPIVAVGDIDIGQTLTFTISQGAVVEPYGSSSVGSQEFAVQSIVSQGGGIIRCYVSEHSLVAGTVYTFGLRSSSALWNIGSAGQIKAELIAMC
jgi:hypothetical protein